MEFGMLPWLNSAGRIFLPFILQNAIYSTLLFAIILPLSILLRKRAVYWQMGLWTLILLRLILPPNLNHTYSGRTLLSRLLNKNILEIRLERSLEIRMEAETPTLSLLQPGDIHRNQARRFHWEGLCFSLWIIGSFSSFILFLKRRRRFHRIINQTAPVSDKEIQNILHAWKARFRIRKPIHLVYSDGYLSPFTLGIIRPVIFLPKSCLTKNPSYLVQSVIAHETAHIKRLDDLWITLQSIIQILFFFHPVVWYSNSRIHLARECICDRMVLSKKKLSAEIYGNGLLAVLKFNLFGSDHAGLVPGFGNQHKKFRIRMQNMKGTQSMNKSHGILRLGMCILLGLFLLPMAQHLQGKAEPATPTLPMNSGLDKEVSAASLQDTSNQRAYIKPIQKEYAPIVSSFGYRINPFTKKNEFHNGVDIASLKGTPVLATDNGIVSETATVCDTTRYGKCVVIQHEGDIWSVYAHLDSVAVKPGQSVRQAEVIGFVGKTGKAAGYHLHFEIRKGGKNIDPEDYIEFKK
jgi:beta-lactamase regulating signal transducer with metallopeptidase domain